MKPSPPNQHPQSAPVPLLDLKAQHATIKEVVREAIDRGVPLDEVKAGNKITQELRRLMTPAQKADQKLAGEKKKLKLSFAR